MNYKIIGDSCSDIDERQKENKHVHIVPLNLQIGDYNIKDDEKFNQKDFINRMAQSNIGTKTAAPSPGDFKNAYEGEEDNIFVVTLSEHLSATYQSAVVGKQLFEEEHGIDKKNIFILSSDSASAGQYRLVLELERLCESGLSFEEICREITALRDKMKTYFVLENLDNLRKNGRLSGLSAFFATTLNIKPVMGSVGGKIVKLDQARGINKALSKMVEIAIKNAGNEAGNMIVTISQVNTPERGEFIANMFKESEKFKDVLVTEAAGVSTVYAGDGGIVISVG